MHTNYKTRGSDYAFPGVDKGITLSKREHFASIMMQALVSNSHEQLIGINRADVAGEAVRMADQLIDALNKIPVNDGLE